MVSGVVPPSPLDVVTVNQGKNSTNQTADNLTTFRQFFFFFAVVDFTGLRNGVVVDVH